MASTFSDLGIELMATGENAGTWGTKTNTNLQIVEKAIAGYVEKSIAGGAQTTTLSITDGDTTESTSVARHAVIKLTGTITGNQIVTVPDSIEKVYIVVNGTSGSFTVQFKTASGTGITFGASDKGTRLLFSDGTNIVDTATGNVGSYDLNGETLILDADQDTNITADTDDQIDIAIAGADDFQFTANTFTALSGSTIATNTIAETTSGSGVTIDSVLIKDNKVDVNGTAGAIILDADADTHIGANTDDEILFTAAGEAQLKITDGAILPSTDDNIDLGSSSAQFKDGFFDGTLEADAITVGGTAVLTGGAVTSITSILNTSLVVGRDADNDIDFATDNNILFRASGADQIKLVDGALAPVTDNDVDLGTSSLEFKDAFFDGTVTTDALAADTANIDGGSIDGATLGTNSAITQAVIDNININGATIGHTSDTDLLTLASGVLTVAGEVSMTTLDIGGTNVTSTAAELNILDGVTSTAAELNILDGVTSTAAELNILDGVTSTTAELNILDGVTSTAAELNILDGVTSTASELNLLDGDTSVGSSITIADSDGVVVNDGGTMKTAPASDFKTLVGAAAGAFSIANLDIDGGTDIGAALADADLLIVDDGAGGTNRKMAASRLQTYIEGKISGDITISSGTAAIGSGVIVNADINSSAAIADSKLDTISTANKVSLAALDIDGGTDIGEAIVDADLFIVDNGAGGTNRKVAASRLTTYINANANFASVGKAIAMAIVFG
jgi:hypothetical protein